MGVKVEFGRLEFNRQVKNDISRLGDFAIAYDCFCALVS